MPEADSPSTPAVEFINDGESLECCAACHHWQQAKIQKTPEGVQAPCRRFPRTAVLMTTMRMGPRGMMPEQGAVMLQVMQPATEVCGEFQLRLNSKND